MLVCVCGGGFEDQSSELGGPETEQAESEKRNKAVDGA